MISNYLNTMKNDLSYWYPLLRYPDKNSVIKIPTTEFFKMNISQNIINDLYKIFDGNESWSFDFICHIIEMMIDRFFKYPVFIRSGQTSNKHNFENSCYLKSKDDIPKNVYNIIEFSEMACLMGLPVDTWVIREYIEPYYFFKCSLFGDLPISKEYRIFIDNGTYLYSIPYWTEEAVKQGKPDKNTYVNENSYNEYKEYLKSELDIEVVKDVLKCVKLIPGKWSIDVMLGKDGYWYLIDMALAEHSWGWKENN